MEGHIIKSFFGKKNVTKKYRQYSFLEKHRSSVLTKAPRLFRNCYISDEELKKRCKINSKKPEDMLLMLIPNNGSVKAGDFSELFLYYFYKGLYKCTFSPKKWRWKEDNNRPALKTDIVLFRENHNSALFSIECKTKATSSKRNPVKDAIEGVAVDKLSRLVKTLVWLKKMIRLRESILEIKRLERFLKATENKPYKKIFIAAAVLDEKLLDADVNNAAKNSSEYVHVFKFKDLHELYESIFKLIPKST